MLSRDLGYGQLARPRQMKAMHEIQKENDMKISRNAQLMFYNYFVDQISKIYWIFQLLYFSFVSLQTQH
jgi:spore maturation protein SpmA